MIDHFVHLHIHSEYSIEDGLLGIESLIDAVAGASMPAAALTDQSNLCAALKFYRAAQARGIKPIIGVELRLGEGKVPGESSKLVLLCQNNEGYKNLSRLITKSYKEAQVQGLAYVPKAWLQDYSNGLIALSGAQEGDVGQAILSGNHDRARHLLRAWQALFPARYYLELQRTDKQGENDYIWFAVELADELALPVVATNNVRFLAPENFDAHEARICIQQGYTLDDNQRQQAAYTNKQYLRNSAEMLDLFHDLPEAIDNTLALAKRCNLELKLGENYLPEFPVPEGYDQNTWLYHRSREGLKRRLENKDNCSEEIQKTYQDRVDAELEVISQMGFSGYFLIVADFIQWAKDHAIPVGPGRGSGAGSLVAYALDITIIDPIRYGLLFERFLNRERISLPDFDVDFCMERRDEVIEYVAERYGRAHVAQIVTYGTMAARAVVRDVGRVLGYPYGFVDQIAKLIPFDLNMTLAWALTKEAMLKKRYKEEEEVKALIDLGQQLEGIARNISRHAGGLVIAPEPLVNYMPLYYEQGASLPAAQFDMHDIGTAGLVKFDFLGLRTLTMIAWTVSDINVARQQSGQALLDINDIPLDDEKTYALIKRNKTTAIFQLESEGMKKLIKRLQPEGFDDLVALLALFRPGPLQSGMVDNYIEWAGNKSEIRYLHPELEPILESTNGIILYQEQVMQIAQLLAGYTLGEADLLRSAMGKKKPEEMAKQREIFVVGAAANGIEAQIARAIFDLMEKFAGYGFNKSHSVAYAMISYQTAWLKANYPAFFMAAALSSDLDNTDKIVMLRDEVEAMDLKLAGPSLNLSQYKFTVENQDTIRFGLGAIKGVGESAIENIVQARRDHGHFTDLFDLCRCVDLRKVHRGVFEALIRSGAADGLGPGRNQMLMNLDKAIQTAEQHSENSHSGQDDFFGLSTSSESNADKTNSLFVEAVEWDHEARLAGEKETLGFYLEGHPIIKYESELRRITTTKLKNMTVDNKNKVRVAGYIHRMRFQYGTRGKMAEIILDDRSAMVRMTVYQEKFQQYNDILIRDHLIIVEGEVIADDLAANGYSIIAHKIHTLNQMREKLHIRLYLGKQNSNHKTVRFLQDSLHPYCRGNSLVHIEYMNNQALGSITLGDEWRVSINDELLDTLRNYFGQDNVQLEY